MCNRKELKQDWIDKYNDSLLAHLRYFRISAEALGLPLEIYAKHDASKWEDDEYCAYVKRFGGGVIDDDEFNLALAHHYASNPHHPEHWIYWDKYEIHNTNSDSCGFSCTLNSTGKILKMPEFHVLEMIADWLASNMAYRNNWDMSAWLNMKWKSIPMHVETSKFVMEKLCELGYRISFPGRTFVMVENKVEKLVEKLVNMDETTTKIRCTNVDIV